MEETCRDIRPPKRPKHAEISSLNENEDFFSINDAAIHGTRDSCLADFVRSADAILDEIGRESLQAALSLPSDAATQANVLKILSIYLCRPALTDAVMKYFRPIVLDLVSRWILADRYSAADFIDIVAAFGYLMASTPQIIDFACELLEKQACLLQDMLRSEDFASLRNLTLALFRLYSIDAQRFRPVLPWSILGNLAKHTDIRVRCYAFYTYALYLDLTDAQISDSLASLFSEETRLSEDGFSANLFLLDESEWVCKQRNAVVEAIVSEKPLFPWSLTDSLLSPRVVNVCGVVLSKREGSPDSSTEDAPLILTKTTIDHLKTISLALSLNTPILLHGPPAAGKSHLISSLAAKTSNQLVVLHLTDSTDAKSLVGSYVCAETPGEFKFQPGILTKAVSKGYWLLIEDIDMAPHDLLALLASLIERRTLNVGSGKSQTIQCAPTFRLFATISSSNRNKNSLSGLSSGWARLKIDSLSLDELVEVIKGRFQTLSEDSRNWIFKAFDAFSSTSAQNDKNLSKLNLTCRDLMKLCNRVSNNAAPSDLSQGLSTDDRFAVYMEAVDIFFAKLSSASARIYASLKLAQVLMLPEDRALFWETQRTLSIGKISETQHQIGRTRLSVNAFGKRSAKSSRPFATTQQSLKLLEQLAVAVNENTVEPVLLTGETGTGKTTTVQQLADMAAVRLHVINLSQQSDATDLLGGFKPVDIRSHVVQPIFELFDEAFRSTFSVKENAKYLEACRKAVFRGEWKRLCTLWLKGVEMAKGKLSVNESDARLATWLDIESRLRQLERQIAYSESSTSPLIFSFVEGTLVKAVRNGDWVLLDEINLASAETLECLSSVLQSPKGSFMLADRGDDRPVLKNPAFRIFACMNPSTDVGKKDLPAGIKSRFTEIWVAGVDENIVLEEKVSEELIVVETGSRNYKDLAVVISQYVQHILPATENVEDLKHQKVVHAIASFHLHAKLLSSTQRLFVGSSTTEKPNYSIRTLSRALSYASTVVGIFGLQRALYEGFYLTYCTLLNFDCEALLSRILCKRIYDSAKLPSTKMSQTISHEDTSVNMFGFRISRGPTVVDESESSLVKKFVVTSSVQHNLQNLARAIPSGYPILLQGPTSAGKTSMIEYVAAITGNRFVRINNHEHTDLQEYLGSYVWNELENRLVFQEGVLVQALRNGWWIVLDELNLAPTDVLEALNRLLDDNREIFVPDTGEVVRPAHGFMLFATQNPAGSIYGGRKFLSRAFRNRFMELHFSNIPPEELQIILEKRCKIAPSYAKKMVNVFLELQKSRTKQKIFDGRDGFMTLRDLFRWAQRESKGGEQLLGEDGYMLLADRVRVFEERNMVKHALEKHLRCKLDTRMLYNDCEMASHTIMPGIVLTKAMKRLYSLVARALLHNEPILLIGETGCGKTTVLQLFAHVMKTDIDIVNCHQHTETSDFIGRMRPARQDSAEGSRSALFEWKDGPLVKAMKNGSVYVLDEISLAEDSVLERLNSVLESSRSLVLSEKGNRDGIEEIRASVGFQFCATMNPGGDFGKKELSPALRNRFTEIWIGRAWEDREDLTLILESRLAHGRFASAEEKVSYCQRIIDFLDWFATSTGKASIVSADQKASVSLRDVLSWIDFINGSTLPVAEAFAHGASMVLLDGARISGAVNDEDAIKFQMSFHAKLQELVPSTYSAECLGQDAAHAVVHTSTSLHIGPFSLQKNAEAEVAVYAEYAEPFAFEAPTTKLNALKVFRAMQLDKNKPILLEGSPGVGKTSLVTALAKSLRVNLVRINLSEQTDLMDLFGMDVPNDSSADDKLFEWRDGPFVQAMKSGSWVLLDELNLANQSVLEGLNACLDHRASVFIPELSLSVECHPNFRVFAAQNPFKQGGGRKGLPQSFLNRFCRVWLDSLLKQDLIFICSSLYGSSISKDVIAKVVEVNTVIAHEAVDAMSLGLLGRPWEFNLRDVFRWLDLIKSDVEDGRTCYPADYFELLYLHRMRTVDDQRKLIGIFEGVFQAPFAKSYSLVYQLSVSYVQLGLVSLSRSLNVETAFEPSQHSVCLMSQNLAELHSLMNCVRMGWLAILLGQSGSGKTNLIRFLAQSLNVKLHEVAMHGAVDSMDILGGYEQSDFVRPFVNLLSYYEEIVLNRAKSHLTRPSFDGHWDELVELKALTETMRRYLLTNDFATFQRCLQDVSNKLSNLNLLDATHDVLIQKLGSPSNSGRFEWMDSSLVEAARNGDWILIDNGNLSSPSVLDRLNSLLEKNGSLMIHERSLANGDMEVIVPHPNFRIFITADPKFGELSRAMRNRGVEINLTDDCFGGQEDLSRALGAVGLHAPVFAQRLAAVAGLEDKKSLLLTAKLTNEGLQRGLGSFDHVFHSISTQILEVETVANFGNSFVSSWPAELSPAVCQVRSELSDNVVRVQPLLKCVADNLGSMPYALASFFRKEATLTGEMVLAKAFAHSGGQIPVYASSSPVPTYDRSKIFFLVSALSEKLKLRPQELSAKKRSSYSWLDASVSLSMGLLTENQILAKIGSDVLEGASFILESYTTLCSILAAMEQSAATMPLDLAFETFCIVDSLVQILEEAPLSGNPPLWIIFSVRVLQEKLAQLNLTGSARQLILNNIGENEQFDKFESLWRNFAEYLAFRSFDLKNLLSNLMSLSPLFSRITLTQKLRLAEAIGTVLCANRLEPGSEVDDSVATIGKLPALFMKEVGALMPAESLFTPFTVQCLEHSSIAQLVFSGTSVSWSALLDSFLAEPSYTLEDVAFMKLAQWHFETDAAPKAALVLKTLSNFQRRILSGKSNQLSSISSPLLPGTIILSNATCPVAKLDQFHQNVDNLDKALKAYTPSSYDPIRADFLLQKYLAESVFGGAFLIEITFERSPDDFEVFAQELDALGKNWIAIGQHVLQEFIPKTPLDPSWRSLSQFCILSTVQKQLELEFQSLSVYYRTLLGDSMAKEAGQVSELSQNAATQKYVGEELVLVNSRRISRSASIDEVFEIFRDISRLRSLASSSRSVFDKGDSLSSENLLQDQLSVWTDRVRAKYSTDFGDIVEIIASVALFVRIGLRYRAASRQIVATRQKLAGLLILTSTPNVMFSTRDVRRSNSAAGEVVALCDIWASQVVEGSLRAEDLQSVTEVYDAFSAAWEVEQEALAKAQQENESLFVFKDEENEDESEYLKLNPDATAFDDDWNDLDLDSAPTNSSKPKLKKADHRDLFVESYLSIFGGAVKKDMLKLQKSRLDIIVSSLPKLLSEDVFVPLQIDRNSLELSRYVLHSKLRPELDRPNWNFYSDPCEPEVAKLKPLLEALSARITELLDEFLENPVLLGTLEIVTRLLNFDKNMPLQKFLIGLERLLAKVAEWESYASRHVTLSAQLKPIHALMLAYRKIEFQQWKVMMDTQLNRLEQESLCQWYRIYRIIFSVPDPEESLELYTLSLFETLNDFLAKSTLVELEPKIRLFEAFSDHLRQISRVSTENAQVRLAFADILHNLACYYKQFTDYISAWQQAKRQPLEKEMDEQIRLMTWRDESYDIMKLNIEKTKRFIGKTLRKYRETALIVPISKLITTLHDEISNKRLSEQIDFDLTVTAKTDLSSILDGSLPAANLVVLRSFDAKKLHGRVRKEILNLFSSSDDVDVALPQKMADQILARLNEIQTNDAKMPVATAETMAKWKENRKMKQNSFAELIKLLRKSGLRLRDTSRNQMMRIVNIRQPLLTARDDLVSNLSAKLSRAQKYLFKILSRYEVLEASCRSPSDQLAMDLINKSQQLACDVTDRYISQMCALRKPLEHLDELLLFVDCVPAGSLSEGGFCTPGTMGGKMHAIALKVAEALAQLVATDSEAWKASYEKALLLLDAVKTMLKSDRSPSLLIVRQESLLQLSSDLLQFLEDLLPQTRALFMQFLVDAKAELSDAVEAFKASPVESEAVGEACDRVIQEILLAIQSLQKPATLEAVEIIDPELGIEKNHFELYRQSTAKKMDGLRLESVSRLVSQLSTSTKISLDTVQRLACVSAFVRSYNALALKALEDLLEHLCGTGKLAYVLINLFSSLYRRGFCVPENVSDDDDEDDDGKGEPVDGTGMAEGQGKKDVSKEIEDEEQVLGLQNEPKSEEKSDEPNKQDEGMEMENDFDGDMEDVPEKESDDDDDDQDSQDEDEVDDEMGDLGEDGGDVIDEKLWGDDDKKDEKESKQDEKVEKDNPASAEGPQELAAASGDQDEDEASAEDDKDEAQKDKGLGDDEDNKPQDDQDSPEINEDSEDKVEESHGIQPRKEEVEQEEAEAEAEQEIDLADMNLDDAESAEDAQDEEMTPPGNDDESPEPDADPEQDEATEAVFDDMQTDPALEAEAEPQQHPDEVPEPESDLPIVSQDVPTSQAEQIHGVEGKDGSDALFDGNMDSAEQPQPDQSQGAQSGSENLQPAASQTRLAPKQKQKSDEEMNPNRSLAEAVKEWKRRIEHEVNAGKDPESAEDNDETAAEYGYAEQDDTQHEKVGFGNASMEEIEQQVLDDSEMQEQEMEQVVPEATELGEVEADNDDKDVEMESSPQVDSKLNNDKKHEKADLTNSQMLNRLEQKEAESAGFPKGVADNLVLSREPEEAMDLDLAEVEEEAPSMDDLRLQLAQELSLFRADADSLEQLAASRKIWNEYDRLTQDLALRLTENLRLILEPTQMSKLKGDYRSGKRLNMKKIIPYIASNFRKDKIWMRRTQPNKRQYQIAIAVDDSKSMKESGAVSTAFESLALVTKAMTQLEVGQVGIMSFGEEVKLLHPFDQPFTNESGANLIRQFSFLQEKTQVSSLLKTTINVMEEQENHTWRLEIIISDGLCDNHATLRQLVVSAFEKKILVLFVVIDNRAGKENILDTKNVDFVDGKLVMRDYMDTFPFDFYVILNDVSGLPETLCEALRQYFEVANAQ